MIPTGTVSASRAISIPGMGEFTMSTFRDPDHWKAGDDEPMTAAQKSYLATLSREAGEDFDEDEILSKAEAALLIEELERQTRRAQS
jgi:Protein of unknown function (DUF3072)